MRYSLSNLSAARSSVFSVLRACLPLKNRSNILKNLAKCICLAANSPLPVYSVLYKAVALSTTNKAYLASDIIAAA